MSGMASAQARGRRTAPAPLLHSGRRLSSSSRFGYFGFGVGVNKRS
jgi:hypothetical protein